MNIKRYEDDIKAALSIVALVLCGGLIFGGGVFIYHGWDLGRQISRIEENNKSLLDKKDEQITKLTAGITKLSTVIEERLPVIVDQISETAEKQDKVSSQVSVAVTQSKRAAATANRAANQAAKTHKKPTGSLRQVPTRSKGPNCFLGKDVYDQPCK